MTKLTCNHLHDLTYDSFPAPLTPGGCEECLREGTYWVALRLCLACGHVGCCDSSPRRHATQHYQATGHPVMRAFTPPAAHWTWCYVHELQGQLPPTAAILHRDRMGG